MTSKEIYKTDKRKLKSRKKIKDAFLSVHSRWGYDGISISSICVEAGISRSTFYAHYKNVNEVLGEVLDEAIEHTGKFWPKALELLSEDEKAQCSEPFCIFVREKKEYQKLFTDDAFSSVIVNKLIDRSFDECYEHLSERANLTRQQLRALLAFQTSGCLSITKMSIREKMTEWDCVKSCIDDFIKSGIKNVAG